MTCFKFVSCWSSNSNPKFTGKSKKEELLPLKSHNPIKFLITIRDPKKDYIEEAD